MSDRVRKHPLMHRSRPSTLLGADDQDVEERSPSRPALAPPAERSQPLPEHLRRPFESGFGHDFSRVRIHADQPAAASAAALDARAYTVGDDVVFGATQYAPDTSTGQMLLAHELSHVVQQSTAGAGNASHGYDLDQPDDARYEREADHAATRVLTGQPAGTLSPLAAGAQVQRWGASLVLAGAGPVVGLVAHPAESVDALWTDLHAFVDRGNGELGRVDADIRDYI